MVVAKNDRAHAALAAQFADHGRSGAPFERGYLAFVWGAPARPHGRIDRPIDRDPRARDRMAVREGGREAVTHWQVLERYRSAISKRPRAKAKAADKPSAIASLLACRLETGRTHQIRVHLSSIGHPVVGDTLYGAPAKIEGRPPLGRYFLHAHRIRFQQPTTGEQITVEPRLYTGDGLLINTCFRGKQDLAGAYGGPAARIELTSTDGTALIESRSGFA